LVLREVHQMKKGVVGVLPMTAAAVAVAVVAREPQIVVQVVGVAQ
jgi:hypothetical protein